MKIDCPSCRSLFTLKAESLKEKGSVCRCSRCRLQFIVHPPIEGWDTDSDKTLGMWRSDYPFRHDIPGHPLQPAPMAVLGGLLEARNRIQLGQRRLDLKLRMPQSPFFHNEARLALFENHRMTLEVDIVLGQPEPGIASPDAETVCRELEAMYEMGGRATDSNHPLGNVSGPYANGFRLKGGGWAVALKTPDPAGGEDLTFIHYRTNIYSIAAPIYLLADEIMSAGESVVYLHTLTLKTHFNRTLEDPRLANAPITETEPPSELSHQSLDEIKRAYRDAEATQRLIDNWIARLESVPARHLPSGSSLLH